MLNAQCELLKFECAMCNVLLVQVLVRHVSRWRPGFCTRGVRAVVGVVAVEGGDATARHTLRTRSRALQLRVRTPPYPMCAVRGVAACFVCACLYQS